jgi:hypothetical protein
VGFGSERQRVFLLGISGDLESYTDHIQGRCEPRSNVRHFASISCRIQTVISGLQNPALDDWGPKKR